MRVQPYPAEVCRMPTLIDLFIEKVRHSVVVKGNGHSGALLLHEPDILDEGEVVGMRDGEAANFRSAVVTQEQQLGPRIRSEPERRSGGRCRNLAPQAESRRFPPLPILYMHGISHRSGSLRRTRVCSWGIC